MRRSTALVTFGLLLSTIGAGVRGTYAQTGDPPSHLFRKETIPYTCEVLRPGNFAVCTEVELPSNFMLSVSQTTPGRTCRHRIEMGSDTTGGGISDGTPLNGGRGMVETGRGLGGAVNPFILHMVHCGPNYTGTVSGEYLIEHTAANLPAFKVSGDNP